jgi:hypothetical protein
LARKKKKWTIDHKSNRNESTFFLLHFRFMNLRRRTTLVRHANLILDPDAGRPSHISAARDAARAAAAASRYARSAPGTLAGAALDLSCRGKREWRRKACHVDTWMYMRGLIDRIYT